MKITLKDLLELENIAGVITGGLYGQCCPNNISFSEDVPLSLIDVWKKSVEYNEQLSSELERLRVNYADC